MLEWAEKQCASEYVAELHAQYNDLISRLEAILMLADMHTADTIDNATLEKWMMMCSDACCCPQYAAQNGAHMVISNPGNIIGDAEYVLWCSFSNYTTQCLTYDFLTPTEHDALKKAGCHLYDPDVEVRAIKIQQHWPLHHCKHLTIIEMAEKGKDEVRSMISQQLRSMPKQVWEALVTDTPSVQGEVYDLDLDANFIKGNPTEIVIGAPKNIKFKEQESYTSLSELIYKPLHYLMKYILKIKDYNTNVDLTLGNVAHYVIECIFRPKRSIIEIRSEIDADFERHFEEGLMRKGMLLWLPENRAERVKLKNGLKTSIISLIDIIDKNHLTIIGCERKIIVDKHLSPDAGIEAKLDMHLQKADGTHVILDLKWTRDASKHYKMLKEERAMQLDIYTSVLSAMPECKNEIICGFFVMPYAKLYTYHSFMGDNVTVIKISHSYAAAMEKIRNSYAYRISELRRGYIEMNHRLSVNTLQYTHDTEEKDLYQMTDEDKKHFDYQRLLD